jgi:site-specific recombinase XerC
LKSPETTRIYAQGLACRLGVARPKWFEAFVTHVSERYSPSEARLRLFELNRLLPVESTPTGLVAAATHADGRLTPLGRALDEFFDAHGLAFAVGDIEARAARRRARVIGTIPEPLRPAVAAYSAAELANRERARRTGGRILSDQTLVIHLEVVADFARAMPCLTDWATVAQSDIEAFLARSSPAGSHILPSLHAFFGWARHQRLILVDPTAQVRHRLQRRFSGPVVDLASQRQLFKHWTTATDVHPNESFIGLLALLHAASVNEMRHLQIDDIDVAAHTVAIKGRPQPVPLDPSTWVALERVLEHRHRLDTPNPHLLVNRRTKVTSQPISKSHANDLLEPLGVTPQRLRCTRLAQLVTTTDPILVVELFGVCYEAVLYYLADTVDEARLANL